MDGILRQNGAACPQLDLDTGGNVADELSLVPRLYNDRLCDLEYAARRHWGFTGQFMEHHHGVGQRLLEYHLRLDRDRRSRRHRLARSAARLTAIIGRRGLYTMASNVSSWLGKGISPQQFMDGMTKNREAFDNWMNAFEWENEETKEFFRSLGFRDDLRCLLLAAEWCGDVVRNVPVLFKALGETGMPVEVMIMEQHTELMDQFLTMGGRAIPIAVFADTGGFVLGQWGPRPKHVQEVMTCFKAENPDREAADYQEKIAVARQEMGRQYGEGADYQKAIVNELRDLLSGF